MQKICASKSSARQFCIELENLILGPFWPKKFKTKIFPKLIIEVKLMTMLLQFHAKKI